MTLLVALRTISSLHIDSGQIGDVREEWMWPERVAERVYMSALVRVNARFPLYPIP